jgi:hypothetical protein
MSDIQAEFNALQPALKDGLPGFVTVASIAQMRAR